MFLNMRRGAGWGLPVVVVRQLQGMKQSAVAILGFVLCFSICYFLCLNAKKVTKEKSRKER
jgi:hypothetical protein